MLGKWLREAMLKRKGKRNPLGDPPLRLPGQGLDEQLDDAVTGLGLALFLPLTMPILWASLLPLSARAGRGWPGGMEVWQAFLCWLAVVVLFWYGAWRMRSRIRTLRLGMLAERMVGQQLERCRTHGYHVFHDIPCTGRRKAFNIDHVLIGPGGIFVVETKAKSKPDAGETVAWVQGNTVQFSDGSYSANAIPQAMAIGEHVDKLLTELIDKSVALCQAFTSSRPLPVRPILVYPGWYIDKKRGDWHDVLLTCTEGVVGFIRKSKPRLSDREAKRIALILGKHLQQERRELIEH
jgi:hypothetical protein